MFGICIYVTICVYFYCCSASLFFKSPNKSGTSACLRWFGLAGTRKWGLSQLFISVRMIRVVQYFMGEAHQLKLVYLHDYRIFITRYSIFFLFKFVAFSCDYYNFKLIIVSLDYTRTLERFLRLRSS